MSGVEVFHGQADYFEGGVVPRVNLRLTGHHFSYLAMDVGSGLDDVTGFIEAGFSGIDDDGEARNGVIVELAPGGN